MKKRQRVLATRQAYQYPVTIIYHLEVIYSLKSKYLMYSNLLPLHDASVDVIIRCQNKVSCRLLTTTATQYYELTMKSTLYSKHVQKCLFYFAPLKKCLKNGFLKLVKNVVVSYIWS